MSTGRSGEAKDLKDASTTTPVRTIEEDILGLANESKQLSLPKGLYVELLAARLIPEENAVVGIVSDPNANKVYYYHWDLKSDQCNPIFECHGGRSDCQAMFLPSSELFILNRQNYITLMDPRGESYQSDNEYKLEQGETVSCIGIMPQEGWLIGITQVYPSKDRHIVIWDITTREKLANYNEKNMPSMFPDMLSRRVIMIRALSNRRVAIYTQDHTEVWDLSSLSDPQVINLGGCFLRETTEGVLTWTAEKVKEGSSPTQFTIQLCDFRGNPLNSCNLSLPGNLLYQGVINVPTIVNLPGDEVLLMVRNSSKSSLSSSFEPFIRYTSLMHFNSRLELVRERESSSSLFATGINHPNLHSLFEPFETSPYLPLTCGPNGYIHGHDLEYCEEYKRKASEYLEQTLVPLLMSVTGVTAPGVARIISSYVMDATAEDTIARLLYPIEPPVEIKKEEMQAFIKQLLPLLQNPKFSTGGIMGFFKSLCTDSLTQELNVILQKTDKTEDPILLQNLYTQVINAINLFMQNQKTNKDIFAAFKKILHHDDFLKSSGAGIPDQISLLSIRKIIDLMKKPEYKP